MSLKNFQTDLTKRRGRPRIRKMPETNIGRLIRAERLKKGWSLNLLASEAGKLGQTISAIELGASQNPQLTTVLPITDALGISRQRVLQAIELDVIGKMDEETATKAPPTKRPARAKAAS